MAQEKLCRQSAALFSRLKEANRPSTAGRTMAASQQIDELNNTRHTTTEKQMEQHPDKWMADWCEKYDAPAGLSLIEQTKF